MNRVSFLVDGFNIYHSAIDAKKDLNGASTLWLNLPEQETKPFFESGDSPIESILYDDIPELPAS